MAEIQVIYEAVRQKYIGALFIDAFSSEVHGCASEVTEYPIEDLGSVADHVNLSPDTLEVEGVVGASGIYSTEGGGFNWIDAYVAIRDLRDTKQLVSVITGLRVYTNMVIEDFSVPRDSESGASLVFSISFREVKIVKAQTVTIPKSVLGGTTGDQRQAQGEVKAGHTPTTTPTPAQQESFLDPIRQQVQSVLGGG